jgi:hypothetical protein
MNRSWDLARSRASATVRARKHTQQAHGHKGEEAGPPRPHTHTHTEPRTPKDGFLDKSAEFHKGGVLADQSVVQNGSEEAER